MKRCFDSIRHNRKLLVTLVTALALMVAVGTTYTLISPASTMEVPEEKLLTEEAAGEVTLSSEEQAEVDKTIAMIDGLPEAEEVELKLAEYENADDMEAYEKYFREISDQAFGAYVYYQDMTPAQQVQVTNRQKLLDMEWMWSAATYAVTTETTVKYLNKGYLTDNGAILVYGGSVAEMLDGGMSYMYWDAIVVEKNDAGGLYVAQHDTSDEIKTGYKASTEDGFVLLVNDRGSLDVRLNCKVTVNFDYKKTAAGYSSAGYGTVSFTDEAPEAEQPPQLTTVKSADTSQLITMNVYNYGSNINDKYFGDPNYPGFQHPTSTTSTSTLGKYGFNFGDWITADVGHTDVTVKGGANINATTAEYTANMPISGIMEPKLVNGYPHINVGNHSMDYLFTDGVYATQKNEESVNGLFQHDPVTGAY
ncbi:MAG: hypothetical protein J6M22_05580, partial [Firmicutes bacterium]|nr:hypothetical protein [Bacillota bacterium]